jgi:hypothetical protein
VLGTIGLCGSLCELSLETPHIVITRPDKPKHKQLLYVSTRRAPYRNQPAAGTKHMEFFVLVLKVTCILISAVRFVAFNAFKTLVPNGLHANVLHSMGPRTVFSRAFVVAAAHNLVHRIQEKAGRFKTAKR